MRAIHRKLLRDLWQIKGQAFAIAAVIGVGVAMFITYFSTFVSLERTRDTYYDRYRMADVFAMAKRAPNHLAPRLAEIAGVSGVRTRVVADVTLDVEGATEPITGRLVSIPEARQPMINDLVLLQGRYLEPGRRDEVLVSEGFALAREIGPGDSVTAVINGRRRELDIVGVALSPEYVYTIRPGDLMPDDARFGIFWMAHEPLAAAFDMEGGFNDVVLRTMPGAQEDEVIARVDSLLEPYGGLGAMPRSLQISAWYLDNELNQLKGFGMITPMIFLAVAAFLLNVVLTRIVSVQREQIAALKALGYSNREVGFHYSAWSLLISASGSVAGVFLGRWLGLGMIGMYNDYFRFPFLAYQLSPDVVTGALLISVGAAIAGAFSSVRVAVALPPAEAMRPEPPARFRTTLMERLGLGKLLSPATRMVMRNLEKRPFRTFASVAGVAASGGLLVIGLFFLDAIDLLLDSQFYVAQRQDVTVSFVEPRSAQALHEVHRLPGVIHAEALRAVPVRLRAGHRTRQTSITGLEGDARLQRIVGSDLQARELPPNGLMMTEVLAKILGIQRGQEVTLEVLEGTRPVRRAVVVDLVDEFMGTQIYMNVDALRDLMREGGILSGAYLQIDQRFQNELYEQLKNIPAVAGVALKSAALDAFNQQMDETMGIFIFFNILFASIITIGVVYNAARIALSERSRELASLRVLGFSRGEISSILLGELAAVMLLALPLGMLAGYGFAALMVSSFDNELFRFPLAVSSRTYATSVLVVLASATLSGLAVRRRLDHLDLVEVLKTRE
ncbi:MAG: ABC transporter permease [Thermoanaerobaculia bacterium]|nr:ABC transporter permease [Thermoanaerobaculia bacterium]